MKILKVKSYEKVKSHTNNLKEKVKKLYQEVKPIHQNEESTKKGKQHNGVKGIHNLQ